MARANNIITYNNFNDPLENEIPYKEISHIAIYISQCSEYGQITFADLDKIGIETPPFLNVVSGMYLLKKEKDINDWINWKPTGQFEYVAIERFYWARDRKL